MAQEFVSEADEFGARLALALKASNMSRSQLSVALAVDKSVISRWLSGQVQPSGYNLARISTLLAKTQPGFNMTLWTASRANFEGALGLSPARPATAPSAPRPERTDSFQSVPERSFQWRSSFVALAMVLLLIAAAGAWLWLRSNRPAAPQTIPAADPSVAVLPFVNMSGNAAKDYLGDGIAEEILNDLANTPNLRVAARTSSFFFKGKRTDIGEVAHKLNVHAVLEGSVRPEGDRIRIVAQLIDAQNGFHLWSARYDRKLDDILAVQDEIARAIVAALSQKLIPRRAPRAIDPQAYRDFLQAQYFLNQRTLAGGRRADELLKDAIARQSDFAAAYALRGHELMLFSDDKRTPSESQKMTSEALRLDPDNQEALDTEVQYALRTWDWDSAYRAGRRILQRTNRNAISYNGIAFLYQYMGFPKLALEAREQAAKSDPLSFSYRRNYALALWHVGRMREALAASEAAFELQPNHLLMLHDLCWLNALTGKIEQARDYGRRIALIRNPNSRSVAKRCEVEISLQVDKAPQVHALLDRTNSMDLGAAGLGLLYARTGDLTKAMKFFAEAYDQRDQSLIWIRFDVATPKPLLRYPPWQALWRWPLLAQWQRYHNRLVADLATEIRR